MLLSDPNKDGTNNRERLVAVWHIEGCMRLGWLTAMHIRQQCKTNKFEASVKHVYKINN